MGRAIAAILRGEDKPLLWALGLVIVVGGTMAGVLGYLVIPKAFVLSILVGAFLSAILPTGPLVMTIKAVAAIGVFAVISAALATLTIGHPWWAALVMAVVAFLGTLWTALPLVGQMAAGLPSLLVLMIITRGKEITGDQHWHGAAIAVACGLVAILLLALIIHAPDPRGAARQLVSQSWDPDSTLSGHGLAAQVLRLDSAPRQLFALLSQASLARIARTLSVNARQPVPDDVIRAGDDAQRAIEATLVPRGRLVPREVNVDTSDLATAEPDLSGGALLGTRDRRGAIEHGRDVLIGASRVPTRAVSSPGFGAMLRRLSVSPDSAVFRFGVQHAVGLGLGALVLLLTDVFPESAFWILLTIFLVLQRNAVATWKRLLQRVAGTWAGALVAAVIALFVPASVLAPWLAVAVVMVGFAFVQRNYTVLAASIAIAIVWFLGSPAQDFWLWAGLRALDTAVGALIAYALSRLILPVRPRVGGRFDDALVALRSLFDHVRDVADEGPGAHFGGDQIAVATAMSDYGSDVDMLGDDHKDEAVAAGDRLRQQWDRVNALVLLVLHDDSDVPDRRRILDDGFSIIESRFTELAKARPGF